jgi:hypothetical protein
MVEQSPQWKEGVKLASAKSMPPDTLNGALHAA